MCQLIEDLLTEAARVGFTPYRIRLGSMQMRHFEQWAAQFTVVRTSDPSQSGSEYDGIPVIPDSRANYRGLVAPDGGRLTLP